MRKSFLAIMAAVALLLPLAAASPASAAPVAAVQTVAGVPMVGVRNCTSSWYNPSFCTDFNRTDQQALRAGGAAAIGVFLCFLHVPCPVVAVTLAVAEVYLRNNGYCTHYLWVRAFLFGPSYAWCT